MRSPINEGFRATGRSTMGVKFVTPKAGDSVAVVARSVESREEEVLAEDGAEGADETVETGVDQSTESPSQAADATIDESDDVAAPPASAASDAESEGEGDDG